MGGYAMVMSLPEQMQGKLDRWGYRPEGLAIMHRLKARWDPQGILNPQYFLSQHME
jgi:FAD/FMN-containing dehydrogenase